MQCKANGCPLKAEFVTNWETVENVTRPKWGVCWYHRQADPERWTITTERIKAYADIATAIRTIANNNHVIFQPIPGESVADYIKSVEATLNKLILGDLDPGAAADNFAKIIQLLSK